MKPEPPTMAEVEEDLVAHLESLGLAADLGLTNEEKVYRASMQIIEGGRVPSLTEIGEMLDMPITSVSTVVGRLVRKGVMKRYKRGLFLPVVEP